VGSLAHIMNSGKTLQTLSDDITPKIGETLTSVAVLTYLAHFLWNY